jgi:hypothetical protein
MPRENAKFVRQQIPNKTPQISYEDIMKKMGMFVEDGKLQLMNNNPQVYNQIKKQQQQNQQQQQPQQYQQQQQPQQKQQQQSNIPQNSYIYNKYFQKELKTEDDIRRPMTVHEYKISVLRNFIERKRINEIKSRKLLMPTSNISIASNMSANLNKLFKFSQK